MGNKYIIDTSNSQIDIFNNHLGVSVEICGKRMWFYTDIKLTPFTEPDTDLIKDEAYKRGYDDAQEEKASCTEPDLGTLAKENFERGYRQRKAEEGKEIQEAYQRGLNDAWETARKIAINEASGGLSLAELDEIFSCDDLAKVFGFTASEAIERIDKYEQKQQFHIGDEIVTQNGFRGFVVSGGSKYVNFITDSGKQGCVETMMAAKTGRSFPEIAEVMEKMKHHD